MVDFVLNLPVFLSTLRCLLDMEVEMFRCSRVLPLCGSGEGSGLPAGQGPLEGRGLGASFSASVLLPSRDGRGKSPPAGEEGRGRVKEKW